MMDEKRERAALQIQSFLGTYKRRKQRQNALKHVMLEEETKAALCIQHCFQRQQARTRCEKIRLEKRRISVLERRDEAAVTIQSISRGYIVRRKNEKERAAVKIQCWVRSRVARRQVSSRHERRQSETFLHLEAARQDAAILMQSVFRVWMRRQTRTKDFSGTVREEAVLVIQRSWRARQCRCLVKDKLEDFRQRLIDKYVFEENAILIQRAFRCHRAHRLRADRNTSRHGTILNAINAEENRAAAFITKLLRSYLQAKLRRRHMNDLFAKKCDLERRVAASRIQRKWTSTRNRERAALTIQRAARRWFCEKLSRQLRDRRQEEMLLEFQQQKNESALVVQRNYRKHVAVRRANELREIRKSTTSKTHISDLSANACVIQRRWRYFQCRKWFTEVVPSLKIEKDRLSALDEQTWAATHVQRLFRGHLVRMGKDRLVQERLAGLKLSRCARGFLGRKRARAARNERRRLGNILKIQSIVRMFLDRVKYRFMLREEALRLAAVGMVQSCVTIQRMYRGHLDRLYTKELRRQLNVHMEAVQRIRRAFWYAVAQRKRRIGLEAMRSRQDYDRLCSSAVEISRVYKGHVARNLFKTEKRKMETASLALQNAWSGYVARYRFGRSIQQLRQEGAVRVIQSVWQQFRVYQAAKRQRLRRIEHLKLQDLQETAAIKMQKVVRGHLSRLDTKRKRVFSTEAAIEIQRVFRGFIGRQKSAHIIHRMHMNAAVRRIQVIWAMKGQGVQQRSAINSLTSKLSSMEFRALERKESLFRPEIEESWREGILSLQRDFVTKRIEILQRKEMLKQSIEQHISTIGYDDAEQAANTVQTAFRRTGAREAVMQARRERSKLSQEDSIAAQQVGADKQHMYLTNWLVWLADRGLHNLVGAQKLLFREASIRRKIESEEKVGMSVLMNPTANMEKRIQRNDPTLTSVNLAHQTLSPQTVDSILRSLLGNVYVQELCLDSVNCINDAFCAGSLAALIRGNRSLKSLSLVNTSITDIGASSILNACSSASSITSAGNLHIDVNGTLMTKAMKDKFGVTKQNISVPQPSGVVHYSAFTRTLAPPKVKCTTLPPLTQSM
eukprot:PhF_6_TR31477/c0_g1_i1/m.46263